ncbi:M15 family metallopeptidase [Candidatus Gracilibacteria bacterium]|nr:M15 family metallopeptidase [Candidatus Gracilibacteria bacterium]
MKYLRKITLFTAFLSLIILSSKALGEESLKEKPVNSLSQTVSGERSISRKDDTNEDRSQFFLGLKKPVRLGLFYDDSSLFRFVSKKTPLNSRDYRPEKLVSISGAHINEAGRVSYIREDAKKSLLEMAEAFELEFGEPLVVISGYRSAEYQQRLWNLGRCHDTLCAPPGYSEHQLGLAVDLFDASTNGDFEKNKRYQAYIAWMQKNGHFYGWHQSYQKGASIDSYEIEPWHWRYLGKEMATRLKRLGWTFTEYVRFQEAIQGR